MTSPLRVLFIASEASPLDCLDAIQRAVGVYRQLPLIWKRIQCNGMVMDFSCKKASQNYLSLYQELMMER